MPGKRRRHAAGPLTEVSGILFTIGGFGGLSVALYSLGGLAVGVIPSCLALIWIGSRMAIGSPVPDGTPGGTRRESQRDWAGVPEYRDPDADLEPGLYERDSRRD